MKKAPIRELSFFMMWDVDGVGPLVPKKGRGDERLRWLHLKGEVSTQRHLLSMRCWRSLFR